MIMTDQDQDGSHIKGLVINFLHHNWPNLLKFNMVEEFITPIVKVFKGKSEMSFYSLPEFEEWQKNTPNSHTWRAKYYKGLGTSSSKEAKEYFSDMHRHKIGFRYDGQVDDKSILLAFSKNKADERKNWLSTWMEERRRRIELQLPESYLYNKETKVISFHDFVHQELVLFSNMDNERSIPSMVDGLKPGQRKVLYTCFKRNLIRELKVAQLAGSVAELSSYHHGEVSLMGTIIGMAQDFVGSNNLNLLMPIGQFGTRLTGGKDAASPRYIHTKLNNLTRFVFNAFDDPLLKYLRDDNIKIEPEWYIPIIPMVLINGCEGIGTGWSTRVLNHDVLDVISNLFRLLDDQEPLPLVPKYNGFTGEIREFESNKLCIFGEVAIVDDTTVEITELPVKTWTQNYKESVLEPMLCGSEKVPVAITDYKEYHTDRTVKFLIRINDAKLREAERVGLHKFFKISNNTTTNSMVLFDKAGCIKRYDSTLSILKEFFEIRVEYYFKRKTYIEGILSAEALKLKNQARFVLEKIENVMRIENKAKKELIRLLKEANYDSDPVRAWKEKLDADSAKEEREEEQRVLEDRGLATEEAVETGQPDYNYILNMPLWSLTLERKNALLALRDKKMAELDKILAKTPRDLYRDDLIAFKAEYLKVLEEAKKELEEEHKKVEKKIKSGFNRKASKVVIDSRPNPMAHRIRPIIDTELLKKLETEKQRAIKRKEKELKKIESVTNGVKNEEPEANGDIPKEVKKKAVKRKSSDLESKGEKKPKTSRVPKNSKNPWEDSDDDDDDVASLNSDDFSADIVVPARTTTARRATTANAKYVISSDDEEDEINDVSPAEEIFNEIDHGQGDRAIETEKIVSTVTKDDPPTKSAAAGLKKKRESKKEAPPKKTKDASAKTKKAKNQAKVFEDSDIVISSDESADNIPRAKSSRSKPVVNNVFDDSDSSEEVHIKRKKSKADDDYDFQA